MAGPGCRICRARRPDAGPGAAVRGVLPAVRRLPRHRRNLAAQFPCRFRRPGRGQTAPLRAAPVRAAGDVAPRSATPREDADAATLRSEEHTSELQSLMRISYAVFCLKKQKNT